KGKVSDLTLGTETISGTLDTRNLDGLLPKQKIEELKSLGKGPVRFVTARVDDPRLVDELRAAHGRFTGQVAHTWFTTLLSWVVPAVIFILFWAFMLRRMSGQSTLMALGKSRARVYVQHKTGVTFNDVAGIDEARGELMEIVSFLKDPARYQRLGGK